MEAVYCNTTPLLPNRLSYPELFDFQKNKNEFYSDEHELEEKLVELLKTGQIENKKSLSYIAQKFDWQNMIRIYDKKFISIIDNLPSN